MRSVTKKRTLRPSTPATEERAARTASAVASMSAAWASAHDFTSVTAESTADGWIRELMEKASLILRISSVRSRTGMSPSATSFPSAVSIVVRRGASLMNGPRMRSDRSHVTSWTSTLGPTRVGRYSFSLISARLRLIGVRWSASMKTIRCARAAGGGAASRGTSAGSGVCPCTGSGGGGGRGLLTNEKFVIGWTFPSCRISKSAEVRSVMGFPDESVTTTSTFVTETLTEREIEPVCAARGSARAAEATQERTDLMPSGYQTRRAPKRS